MKSLLFCLAFLVVLSPLIVFAQDTGLVPCGYDEPCTTADVATFANWIISFLISILGIIATIALVYAGILLVTSGGDTNAATRAKTLFTNVVIGIILILAAWLIVDTIMRALTGSGLDFWGRLT